MKNNLLVFASKKGGLNLVEYLLSINAPLARVIVASHSDTGIIKAVSSREVPVSVYDRDLTLWLPAEGHSYGWLLNLWSPHILKPSVLALANHRLNIHPSLAPYCRGNDNAAWTLRKNVPAGVSLMEMGENIDGGDIYIQREVPYLFPVRGKELNARLINEANNLFQDNWPSIYAKDLIPYPQNGTASYHTRSETEQDRVRDFSEVTTIGNCLQWVLAHDFSPGTTAELDSNGKKFKVTVSLEEI